MSPSSGIQVQRVANLACGLAYANAIVEIEVEIKITLDECMSNFSMLHCNLHAWNGSLNDWEKTWSVYDDHCIQAMHRCTCN
jgi:hypothetical protein